MLPNGLAQAQRRDREAATAIIASLLAGGAYPQRRKPLSPGAGFRRISLLDNASLLAFAFWSHLVDTVQ
jgi:hypothetical protein